MLTCSGVILARNGKAKQELGFAGLCRHSGGKLGGLKGCCAPQPLTLLPPLALKLLPVLGAELAGHCPAEKGTLCNAGFVGLFFFPFFCFHGPSIPG